MPWPRRLPMGEHAGQRPDGLAGLGLRPAEPDMGRARRDRHPGARHAVDRSRAGRPARRPSMRPSICAFLKAPPCSRFSAGEPRQTMHQQCFGPPRPSNSASKSSSVFAWSPGGRPARARPCLIPESRPWPCGSRRRPRPGPPPASPMRAASAGSSALQERIGGLFHPEPGRDGEVAPWPAAPRLRRRAPLSAALSGSMRQGEPGIGERIFVAAIDAAYRPAARAAPRDRPTSISARPRTCGRTRARTARRR